jgi:YVTN family beta-propeller protein
MKTLIKIVLWSIGFLAAGAIAVAGYLIYPGTPSRSSSLIFQGYVPLRSDAVLSVLDYLTVKDDQLFVTGESTGDVYRVLLNKSSMSEGTDVTKLSGERSTHGFVFDPASHLAFVTRSQANTVDILDPARMVVIKRIPVADDPDAIFYDEFDKLVYVASGDSHLATLIDPSTQATIATIPLGGAPEYAAFEAATRLLYQNLHDTSQVIAVDIAKRSVVKRWPLQGCQAPTGMAIDELHRRLFIACNENSLLAIFDLNEHRVVTTVPIGKNPDSVAFDIALHRIYTTGKSGDLVVVQQDEQDKFRVRDTVHLHYGAHTLTVDPATHALYVGYAGLVVNPRVAVFTPRP